MLKRLIHIGQLELNQLILIGGHFYTISRIGLFPREMRVMCRLETDRAIPEVELRILDPFAPCEIYIPIS